MDDAELQMAAALEALRLGYLERLPIELEALNGLACHLLEGEELQRAPLDELLHRLHKLAGSGGTFGLDQLSQQARRLELRVKGWLQPGRLVSYPERLQFQTEVAALREQLVPVRQEPPPPASGEVARPTDGGMADEPGNVRRIWLVADDLQLGEELVLLLGQFGFEVRYFSRLDELEAAAAQDAPDALLLDISFPHEGRSSVEAFATSPVLQRLSCPLLFMSGQSDFATRLAAARAGAAGFLRKPVDVPRLVDRLETLLESARGGGYRVLLVDDDRQLGERYRLVLQSAGMEVLLVTEPGRVVEQLADFHPDLLVVDMVMPECSGAELALVIRQYDEWLGLPIVFLSAETDLDAQLAAMRHGADEFLTKPISDRHLVTAVKIRAARARQLEELLSKDSMTGLLKHSYFKEALRFERARAERSGLPLSVVMVDIDHFKQVNDRYGHPVGDRVLRALAQLLKQRLRKSDIVGRYGGEEFAILLPECDSRRAQSIIEDIRSRFSALPFYHEEQSFSVTLSAGVACSSRYAMLDGDGLLAQADSALYIAKHGGRNRVSVVD